VALLRPAQWIEAFPRGKRAFCGALFFWFVFFSQSDAFGMGNQKKMNIRYAAKNQ